MSRAAVRRVVTGHNDEGRAVILFDGPSPQHFESEAIPGFGATVPWMTRSAEIDHVTDDDASGAKAEIPTFPASGQTILRIADFPPDTVYPTNAGNAIFTEIDGHDEAEAGADSSGGKHFWFHRTDSLDYAVVLEGEIVLMVDDGETVVRAGDVIVQRATSHAWSNRTDQAARILFVLIGTPELSAVEIGERRQQSPDEAETA